MDGPPRTPQDGFRLDEGVTAWPGKSSSLRKAVLGALVSGMASLAPVPQNLPADLPLEAAAIVSSLAGRVGLQHLVDPVAGQIAARTEIAPGGSCFGARADMDDPEATRASVQIVATTDRGRRIAHGSGTVIRDSGDGRRGNRILTASHVVDVRAALRPGERPGPLRIVSSKGEVLGEAIALIHYEANWNSLALSQLPPDLAVLEVIRPTSEYRAIRGLDLLPQQEPGIIDAASGGWRTGSVTSGDSGAALLVRGRNGESLVAGVIARATVVQTEAERLSYPGGMLTTKANMVDPDGGVFRRSVERERGGFSASTGIVDRGVLETLGEAGRNVRKGRAGILDGRKAFSYGYGRSMCNRVESRITVAIHPPSPDTLAKPLPAPPSTLSPSPRRR